MDTLRRLCIWLFLFLIPLVVFWPKLLQPSVHDRVQYLTSLQSYIDFDLPITIPVTLEFGDIGFSFPDLVRATQLQIDSHLRAIGHDRFDIVLLDNLFVDPLRKGNTPETENSFTSTNYSVEMVHASENFVVIDSSNFKAFNFFTSNAIQENDVPYFVAQCILYHLLKNDLNLFERTNPAFYQPRLVVNLISVFLTGDKYVEIPLSKYQDDILGEFLGNMSSYISLDLQHHVVNTTEGELTRALSGFRTANALNLINTHKGNQVRINDVLPHADISFFDDTRPVLTKEDLLPIMFHIRIAISAFLNIPQNPRDNMGIKLWAMKRYHTLNFLLQSLKNLRSQITASNVLTDNHERILGEVEEIVGIICDATLERSLPDWDKLFRKSMNILDGSGNQHPFSKLSIE